MYLRLGPLSMEPPRRATRDTQKKPQQPKPTVLVKPTQVRIRFIKLCNPLDYSNYYYMDKLKLIVY